MDGGGKGTAVPAEHSKDVGGTTTAVAARHPCSLSNGGRDDTLRGPRGAPTVRISSARFPSQKFLSAAPRSGDNPRERGKGPTRSPARQPRGGNPRVVPQKPTSEPAPSLGHNLANQVPFRDSTTSFQEETPDCVQSVQCHTQAITAAPSFVGTDLVMTDVASQVIREEGETPTSNGSASATMGQGGYFDSVPQKPVRTLQRNGASQANHALHSSQTPGGAPQTPSAEVGNGHATHDAPVPQTPGSTRPSIEAKESQSQTTTKKTISRLQRMFSQSGRKESSSVIPSKSSIPSTPHGSQTPEEGHPVPRDPEKEERMKHLTADERVVAMRFDYNEHDGTHAHHLKRQKREEKLKNMLKDMLGGKAKREEEERKQEAEDAHQLSLITSWVAQNPHQDTDEAAKIAKQKDKHQEQNFVEKYGRCQEIVGRGAFGIVRIAHKIDPATGKEKLFAVKEFRKKPTESEKKYQKRLTSEYCISSAAKHPNIINTMDLLQDAQGDYCEVMEYCAGGDLYSLILAAGKLELHEADCYFKQLMRGVNYLHDMGVAHRDLKPENLLLTPSGSLKIADFGNGECFRMAWEKESHMTAGLCGSAPYIAPEEYLEKEFDPAEVDIWACGVIFMAMRTGRHLWRMAKRDEDDFYERYLEGRKTEGGYEPIEALSRARCRNVVYSMLDPNPKRRLTSKQVLDSEWLSGIWTCKAADVGA